MPKKRAENAAVKVNVSRGRRKLTDEQVLAMVGEYIPRVMTLKMLAVKYGVGVGSVHAIIKGRTYAWLTGIGVPTELAQAA